MRWIKDWMGGGRRGPAPSLISARRCEGPARAAQRVVLLIAGVTAAGAAPALGVEERVIADDTRIFILEHLSTKQAQVALRTLLEVRRIFEDPSRGMLVLRDDAVRLDAAAALLRQMDLPEPRWQAELVLASRRKEHVVRRIDLEDEKLNILFGKTDADFLSLDIAVLEPGSARLGIHYAFDVRLPGDAALKRFRFYEGGNATLEEDDELVLLEVAREGPGEALGRLLGVETGGRRLLLRFVPLER